MKNQEFDFKGFTLNGFVMLFAIVAALVISGLLLGFGIEYENAFKIVTGCVLLLAAIVAMCGFIMIEPNEARVMLFFGKYHPVDSKEVAFKSAARLAYKEACAHAAPALIEPIYRYYIHVPNDYVGAITSDLPRRRGVMEGMNPTDDGTEVVARAPMGEMVKYATDLRSMTQARGYFTKEFIGYEDVPGAEAKKIIEQAKREDEEEE